MMEHKHTKGLYGSITHTDFVSSDPDASKAWCAKVLGWTFMASIPTAEGDYHLFAYSEQGGGGIRRGQPAETPSCLPFVHVEDAQIAFDAALREGAEAVVPPTRVMPGVTTAVVRAPGGLVIGFSGA